MASLVEETVEKNPFIPARYIQGMTDRQFELLGHEGREVLYGGAAGGGKSVGMLLAAAQYVTEPRYSALILRRTFKQLSKSDSILALAKEWWLGMPGVRYNADLYTFTFPTGATIEFGHLEHEDAKYNYQGGAWRFVGYDELTQFAEPMYTFLFSRQRRDADSPIPLRMRATSNPGGVGHDWVKKRFIDPKTRDPRAAFIPAKLDDNPNIDRESYVESLSFLDPVTRGQMLAGDWDAVEGGRFKREWFRYFRKDPDSPDFVRSDAWRFKITGRPVFMTVDPAASAKQTADYTVVGVFAISPAAELLWLACERFQKEIPDIVPEVARLVRRWKPQFVAVEAVASNRAVAQILRGHKDPVVPVREVSPKGLDKLTRATPAMVMASSGRLYLPEDDRSFPAEDVIGELVRFTGDEKKDDHDDIVDALSYACELLPQVSQVLNAKGPGAAPGHYNSGGPFDGRAMPTRPAIGGVRR